MKKFFYLFTIMVVTFMSVSYVNADVGTTYNVLERDFIPLTNIYGDSNICINIRYRHKSYYHNSK